jgi:methionyl aminopeptidase
MAAEGAASSDGAAAHYCASDLCYKPATMQCPSCLEAGMPPSFFCSKECFKRSWKEHNRTHKVRSPRRVFRVAPAR